MKNYLYAYMIAGTLFLLSVITKTKLTKNREPSWSEIAEANDPNRGTFSHFFENKILAPLLGGSFVILTWPYFLFSMVKEHFFPIERRHTFDEYEFNISPIDLRWRMSVKEIEQREMIEDPLDAVPQVPFGFLNPQWNEFLQRAQENDEIWSFCCAWEGRWEQLHRRDGYALVRKGAIGEIFVTAKKPLPMNSKI